jgi:uncharacterized protein (TIGR04255 family)
VEAVFDFRVKQEKSFNVRRISALAESLQISFPKSEEIRPVGFIHLFKDKGEVSREPEKDLLGHKLITDDNKNILQIRVDGFTYSRLKPYTGWKELIGEARKYWNLYCEACMPEFVIRSAVRYINHFTIPGNPIVLKEYLPNPPVIPEGCSHNINRFLTQVTSTHSKNIMSNFILVYESTGNPNESIIIMDIDVYRQKESEPTDEEIWPVFEDFRNIRNNLFFGNITEHAVEMFQ